MTYEWTSSNIRQLISVVKLNPNLYEKGRKCYKDATQKTLCWEAVGKALIPPCSGKHNKFYLL